LSQDVLLVVDEWEAAATQEAEELLSMLVEGLDIRFLITTRTRPDWFTPRLEVYGEGLEIGLDELAMTEDEATRVLAAAGAVSGRARLMRTADGWPAVLGLAAMSGDVDFTSSDLLSQTLYDFLASELLASATHSTQTALMLLAVTSVSDGEVARAVLGPTADNLLEEAVKLGLLAVTERNVLSLHPLLRELLIRRFENADAETRTALLLRCRTLFEGHRWDEALSVAEIARNASFATDAVDAALNDLLAAGRTSSLRRWVAAARAAGAGGGLIDYAESEALLRGNKLDEALALATQATGTLEGDLFARAHLVAGRSAHLMDRTARAELHGNFAAASAKTAETREGALWLHCLTALEQQPPDLRERLRDFRTATRGGLKQTLMHATLDLGVALIEGGLVDALDNARGVLKLATKDADPMAHTGLLSVFGYALGLNGRYVEALEGIDVLVSLAESNAIEFALRYALVHRARALTGLRKFAPATRSLATIERHLEDEPNGFIHDNVPIERARLYASTGDLKRALNVLSLGPPARATKAARSEFIGWQALLSAIAADSVQAKSKVAEARHEGRSLEAESLALLSEAIVALNNPGRGADPLALIEPVIQSGVHDPIVIAVRAAPSLGAFLAAQPQWRPWFQQLLVGSRDTSLAASLGLHIPREAKERTRLSPRETEVHELLAHGLTNEEISKLLYISLSTTKVHVKHIFEKLGVRSRLEAARALRGDI
jgi:ATP/maltotriose-dependent transcriptional regulator MalT